MNIIIARRIENAEEVEIEEYYDVSGKGSVGVKGTAETVTVEASGEGRKVTKRIIKFKGFSVTQIPESKIAMCILCVAKSLIFGLHWQ